MNPVKGPVKTAASGEEGRKVLAKAIFKMAKDIQKAEKVLAKAQLALHVAGDPAINAAFNKLAKVARILELAAQKGPGSAVMLPLDYTESEDSLARSRSPRRHADGPASG